MFQLQQELPVKLEEELLQISNDSGRKSGLVIVDEVNGFCTVGCGSLAPLSPNRQISNMIQETARIAKEFSSRNLPILAFTDCHHPDRPEHPYPPHCLSGSGEDELVPELKWLEKDQNTVVIRKDCMDGFIGAIQPDGSNKFIDWIKENHIQQILVVGTCTDICVLDFVCSAMSARNHGLLHPLEEVILYADGCSTFEISVETAQKLGVAAHPQDTAHHIGLYIAASRGAKLVGKVDFKPMAKVNGLANELSVEHWVEEL